MAGKPGFRFDTENIEHIMFGGRKTVKHPIKRRIIKNLFFEGENISTQTKKKLKQVWW